MKKTFLLFVLTISINVCLGQGYLDMTAVEVKTKLTTDGYTYTTSFTDKGYYMITYVWSLGTTKIAFDADLICTSCFFIPKDNSSYLAFVAALDNNWIKAKSGGWTNIANGKLQFCTLSNDNGIVTFVFY